MAAPPSGNNEGMKPSRNYRDLLRSRNSELDVDDEDAVYDYLDTGFKEYDTMKGENEKARQASKAMKDLIESDRDAKNIFDGLLTKVDEDGNPFTLIGYVLNEHFDEIKDSQSAEEALQRIAKKQDEQAKAEEEKAARHKTREENYKKAEDALAQAKKEVGADNKTAGEMLAWLLGEDEEGKGLIWRAPMYDFTKDDFVKLLYAYQRDKELDQASNRGRQEGLSQRPGAAHRRTETPTDLGMNGSGSMANEEETDPTVAKYGRMKPRFT